MSGHQIVLREKDIIFIT